MLFGRRRPHRWTPSRVVFIVLSICPDAPGFPPTFREGEKNFAGGLDSEPEHSYTYLSKHRGLHDLKLNKRVASIMIIGITIVTAIWLMGATAVICCAVGAAAEKRLDPEPADYVEQRQVA